jgi:hypothetical protein
LGVRAQREASSQDAKGDQARSVRAYAAMDFHGRAPAVRVYCCGSGRPKPAARNLALAIGCVNELASGQDQFQSVDRGGLGGLHTVGC